MRGHFMNDILKHNLFASIVRRSLHVYPNVHCERTTRTGSQCEVRNLPRFEFNTNGCQTFEDRITRPICDKHKTCNRYNPSYVFHLQLANTVWNTASSGCWSMRMKRWQQNQALRRQNRVLQSTKQPVVQNPPHRLINATKLSGWLPPGVKQRTVFAYSQFAPPQGAHTLTMNWVHLTLWRAESTWQTLVFGGGLQVSYKLRAFNEWTSGGLLEQHDFQNIRICNVFF